MRDRAFIAPFNPCTRVLPDAFLVFLEARSEPPPHSPGEDAVSVVPPLLVGPALSSVRVAAVCQGQGEGLPAPQPSPRPPGPGECENAGAAT